MDRKCPAWSVPLRFRRSLVSGNAHAARVPLQYRPRTPHTIAERGHHPQRGPPEARENPVQRSCAKTLCKNRVSWSTILGYNRAGCVREIEEVGIRADIGTGGKSFRVSRTTERESVSPTVRAPAARSLLAGLQSRARLPALRQVL